MILTTAPLARPNDLMAAPRTTEEVINKLLIGVTVTAPLDVGPNLRFALTAQV